jgi:5-methylcytosine-specific restriction endonuclease McrA
VNDLPTFQPADLSWALTPPGQADATALCLVDACIRHLLADDLDAAVAAVIEIDADALRARWHETTAVVRDRVAVYCGGVPLKVSDPVELDSRMSRRIFERDHFICRYCGVRTIDPLTLIQVSRLIGNVMPYSTGGSHDPKVCHPIHWTLGTSFEHIKPRVLGGSNEDTNLIAACCVCNYAKNAYTLDELSLLNPMLRPVPESTWDGLSHYLPMLSRLLDRGAPARQRPAGDPKLDLPEDLAVGGLIIAVRPDRSQPRKYRILSIDEDLVGLQELTVEKSRWHGGRAFEARRSELTGVRILSRAAPMVGDAAG